MNEKHNMLYFLDFHTLSLQLQQLFQILDFSNFQGEIERKLVKLHFLSLNQIPKMIIFKVTIKVDQGAFTF